MKTPSKINLFLEVIGKKKNGYHMIRTIFYPLKNPSDEVSLETVAQKGIFMVSNSDEIPLGKDNICWKAAVKFAKEAAIEPHWKIRIKKAIPVAAGLGGGSSDAAAILRILDKKYPNRCEIRKIATNIGADLAFFLNPIPSLGEGIGEKLSPIKVAKKIPILLINPLFPVSAAWAYSNFRKKENNRQIKDMLLALEDGDVAKIANCLRNDLATALYYKFPLLLMIKESMIDAGALGVEISGSGSSIFGIFQDIENVYNAKEKLLNNYGTGINAWCIYC